RFRASTAALAVAAAAVAILAPPGCTSGGSDAGTAAGPDATPCTTCADAGGRPEAATGALDGSAPPDVPSAAAPSAEAGSDGAGGADAGLIGDPTGTTATLATSFLSSLGV